MNLPESKGSTLFATICNTVGEASAYALWFSRGGRQFVVDLADHLRGTGGLTGIAYHDGRLYVAVQSSPARILVLDMTLTVIETITHPDFDDLHSLHIADDSLIVVSTRAGGLFQRHLLTGDTQARVRFDPRAWVCDALYTQDDILLCCHHIEHFDTSTSGGGVFSVMRKRVLLDGLSGPHSLTVWRDEFAVLDSANADLVFFRAEGPARRLPLLGFLRGAVAWGDTLLVAGGPDRTISRKNPEGDGARDLRQVLRERLRIFEVKQDEIARTMLPECPGFEIYDMIAVPEQAGLRPAEERLIPADQGLFARFFYTALVTAHARK